MNPNIKLFDYTDKEIRSIEQPNIVFDMGSKISPEQFNKLTERFRHPNYNPAVGIIDKPIQDNWSYRVTSPSNVLSFPLKFDNNVEIAPDVFIDISPTIQPAKRGLWAKLKKMFFADEVEELWDEDHS